MDILEKAASNRASPISSFPLAAWLSRQDPAAAGEDSDSKKSPCPKWPKNIGVFACSNSPNVAEFMLNNPGVPNFKLLDFKGQNDFFSHTSGTGLYTLIINNHCHTEVVH